MIEAAFSSRWGEGVAKFRHRLAETGLFDDAALIRLLDAHPRDQLDICTMELDAPADKIWVAGEASGLSGAELFAAIKRGALWVSARGALAMHAEFRSAFDAMKADLARHTRQRVLRACGSVIMAGPRMGAFYHSDPGETVLCHVRGTKTFRVYPADEAYLSEPALESVLLKQGLGEVPWTPQMDAGCETLVLEAGDGVSWPLHAPHRAVNGEGLNVSVSMEYATVRSTLTNGVVYANGVMRRRFGLNPRSRGVSWALKPAYWLAARMLRRLPPVVETAPEVHARQFDVDPSAPGCVAWRPGFGPQSQARAA